MHDFTICRRDSIIPWQVPDLNIFSWISMTFSSKIFSPDFPVFQVSGYTDYVMLDRSWDRDTIPCSYDWSQGIFIVYVPIESSTHYPDFNTVWLHYQTILMPACQAGRLFVTFNDGLWCDQATKPSQRVRKRYDHQYSQILSYKCLIFTSSVGKKYYHYWTSQTRVLNIMIFVLLKHMVLQLMARKCYLTIFWK